MRVLFYCAVLLVAAGSVVFGLDWVSAPMPAMPESKNIVFVPPPPPPPPRVVPVPAAAPSAPAMSQPAPASQPGPAPSAAPVAAAPRGETPRPVATAPRPKCDIDACAGAYRSFDETDCTYNPSFGPRRLCTRGDPEKYARDNPAPATPPQAATPAAPPAQTAEPGSIIAPEPGTVAVTDSPGAPPPRCNVSACAAAYPRSLREADCTFNPGSGPRRVCEK